MRPLVSIFVLLFGIAGLSHGADPVISPFHEELLRTVREPRLDLAQAVTTEQYRLFYSPSFSPDLIFRAERKDGQAQLRALELSDADSSGQVRIRQEKTIPLSAAQWQRLQTILRAMDFWKAAPQDEVEGTDGSDWLVEGRRGTDYHAMRRWTPSMETKSRRLEAFLLLGKYLATLSGLGPTVW